MTLVSLVAERQAENPDRGPAVEPFSSTLARHGLELKRGPTTTLQINVGLRCNQSCRHCHVEAGPDRVEMMTRETLDEVVGFARRGAFEVIDITGGAPELHPEIAEMTARLAPLAKRTLFRCNLTALAEDKRGELIEVCQAHRVSIVASFPSLDATQAEAQRGRGVFSKSLAALQWLNELGYGCPGSDLELELVANPAGAFLPVSQAQAEKKFRKELNERWGIRFHHLYNFCNVPLGRFRRWLLDSGNYGKYMQKLASSFNPCTIGGLMCRSLVSVDWNGNLFDCDFNLAAGIPLGGQKRHVSEMAGAPEPGEAIALSDHCYACTAGAGFT
ncbi:MAG: arsenosugar biosynthesis radical SAM protein ArsS [Syntrophaceae bacterium]|jgi:radical SAM/Cys-rich protein|nr:arsenosugar biosynthesis radical SAM protein ArsS [Syntrophaceae bacterium]